MQYNGDAHNLDIVSDIDYWAGTNSTTYPIEDKTRNANFALDRVTTLVLRSDSRWSFDDLNNTDLPIGTTDLVSGQSDYALAVAHLKESRLRVKDPNGNWITLDPVRYEDLTDDELAATGTPQKYAKVGNSLIVCPTPSYGSTGGLEMQFQRSLGYFTTTDDAKEPGFASQFHRLISLYAALDYCEANGKDQRAATIRPRIQAMEQELIEFYADRDRDDSPRYAVEPTMEQY